MPRNTEFTDKLRSSGLRPTKQRLKICEALFNREHTFHFTINDLAKKIKSLSNIEIEKLETTSSLNFKVNETEVSISLEDVEINYKDIEGLSVASGNGQTIALDLSLNEQLINEGIAREIVNRVQNIRKSEGLEVTDKIEINIKNSDNLEKAINDNLDYVIGETLAIKLYFSENLDVGDIIEFDNIKTRITIKKV